MELIDSRAASRASWHARGGGGGRAMKMDPTNLAIIQELRDGRKSFKRIAQRLSLAENTVRSRVNSLLEEGALEITGLVDPESLPGHRAVIVGVKLKTMDLVQKGAEFSRLRGVVSVSVVTGRFDLMLLVLLSEQFGLLEFYTEEVSRIEDVQSVETFVIYKGYHLKIPYIL
jgi:Lrp/AsnC family transcriptional regulator, regulator for asnA, asnC and gidA